MRARGAAEVLAPHERDGARRIDHAAVVLPRFLPRHRIIQHEVRPIAVFPARRRTVGRPQNRAAALLDRVTVAILVRPHYSAAWTDSGLGKARLAASVPRGMLGIAAAESLR